VKGAGVGTLFPGIACAIGRDVYAFEPSPKVDFAFVVHALNSNIQAIVRTARGDIPGLSKSDILDHEVPLPPLAEQRRIVAKLDALDASAKRARADLDRIPTLVARAKQAILAETYSGPMTTIENVAESLDQGWSPKCDNVPATSDDDWAVMTTTAIQALKFSGAENKVLPRSVEPRPKLELAPGDFLVTRAGPRSRVGVVCVVERTRPHVMLCDKAYRLRFKSNTDPLYVAMMCNSPQAQHEIELMKTGGNDSGLNLTQAKFLALPIPQRSLREQREIVRRIEAAFAKIDRIAAEAASARALLDRLDQAILAKAFRGELVPQDPSDEPAEKLLEKIKAARAATPARKTRKKQS
jgi:type I restriction enzyme S subunit